MARHDQLIIMEAKVIASGMPWMELFESDPDPSKPKYMITFPYPYMTGYLHVGHLFTLMKVEFASCYHRCKGGYVIFSFSFHCTGMPIQAAANKLKRELETSNFSRELEEEPEAAAQLYESSLNKAHGKKSKAAAKTGGVVHQYDILKISNIPEESLNLRTLSTGSSTSRLMPLPTSSALVEHRLAPLLHYHGH